MELQKLMDTLWVWEWRLHRTACTGWIPYEEDGEIHHWCREAEEVLKLMERKGIVEIKKGVVKLREEWLFRPRYDEREIEHWGE